MKVAARGVYYLPWYGPNGEIFLAAVNRNGSLVAEAIVLPGESPEPQELLLEEMLDKRDPMVELTELRGGSSSASAQSQRSGLHAL